MQHDVTGAAMDHESDTYRLRDHKEAPKRIVGGDLT
jgi:hypothetical protein